LADNPGEVDMPSNRIFVAAIASLAIALLVGCVNSPEGRDGNVQFIFGNQGDSYQLEAAGESIQWATDQLSQQTGIPGEYLLFYRASNTMFDGVSSTSPGKYSRLLDDESVLASDDVVNVLVRPVAGDHVHSIYSMWIEDGSSYKLMRPLYDDELERRNPAADGETEYYFFKLHNGLHTHGKGLMHVHPWTSPLWFHETDGLGATLGNWLDDVGVTLRQPPYRKAFSLQFHNGIYLISKPEFGEIISNEYPAITTRLWGECFRMEEDCTDTVANQNGKTWKVLYWKHYLDFENNVAPEVITEDIGNVWLGRNLGVVILVYGAEEHVIENARDYDAAIAESALRSDIREVTNAKLAEMKASDEYMNLRQFDGQRYPSPQADDDRYEKVDLTFPLRDQEL